MYVGPLGSWGGDAAKDAPVGLRVRSQEGLKEERVVGKKRMSNYEAPSQDPEYSVFTIEYASSPFIYIVYEVNRPMKVPISEGIGFRNIIHV